MSGLAPLLPTHERLKRQLRSTIDRQRAAFETRNSRLMKAEQFGQLGLVEGEGLSNGSDGEHAPHYMHASIIKQEEYACKN